MGYCVMRSWLPCPCENDMFTTSNKTCIYFNYFENERDLSFTTLNGMVNYHVY